MTKIYLLISSVICCLLLSGCGRSHVQARHSANVKAPTPTASSHNRKCLELLAIDCSGSTAAIRARLLSEVLDFATNLNEDDSEFLLFRFSRTVQEIYSGVPRDEDAFALMLKNLASASDPRRGTDYAELLHLLANRAASTTVTEVHITIAGDGLDDFVLDKQKQRLFRMAAQSLVNDPKVKYVRVWGIQPGAREVWQTMFGASGKLQLKSLDQHLGD